MTTAPSCIIKNSCLTCQQWNGNIALRALISKALRLGSDVLHRTRKAMVLYRLRILRSFRNRNSSYRRLYLPKSLYETSECMDPCHTRSNTLVVFQLKVLQHGGSPYQPFINVDSRFEKAVRLDYLSGTIGPCNNALSLRSNKTTTGCSHEGSDCLMARALTHPWHQDLSPSISKILQPAQHR